MPKLIPKPKEKIIIDAAGKSLGRLSTEVANKLRGKHLVTFAANVAPRVQITVINVTKLRFTGTKLLVKKYFHFSGYPGGIKETTLQQEFTKDPVRLVRSAVKHMLPKNRLSSSLMRYLNIYRNEN